MWLPLRVREILRSLFRVSGNGRRAAKTWRSKVATSEAMQTPGRRDAHGAPRQDRHPGLNAVGKATEDSLDDYRKSGCSVSFCRPNCLAWVARRSRKFSFGLSSLNREGANCRCETPESISNAFERSGSQLVLTCDRNQTVRCSCFHVMVAP